MRTADDFTVTAREAFARGVPILIVFTEKSCRYCERAKREYLIPLQASRKYGGRVIMREVDIASESALSDFDDRLTTHAGFARRHKVRVVPTVMVVDHQGRALSEPIVGLLSEDFYRLYLEQAIEEGSDKLRGAGFPDRRVAGP